MEKQPQISRIVTQRLMHEIRHGIYKDATRLPPEVEIAALLGVSRTSLRDSLAMMEREGFISRKHGVGTIINRHVLAVRTRMDLEVEFLDMIAAAGYEASVTHLRVEYGPAGAELAAKLHIGPADEVIHVARVVAADGVPAIHCTDSIARASIADTGYDEAELTKPIFDFLEKYCHTEVYMDLTEVKAVAAEGDIAACFAVPIGTPLLFMDEVGYTFKGEPVLHSGEYYNNDILKHMVMRKKI